MNKKTKDALLGVLYSRPTTKELATLTGKSAHHIEENKRHIVSGVRTNTLAVYTHHVNEYKISEMCKLSDEVKAFSEAIAVPPAKELAKVCNIEYSTAYMAIKRGSTSLNKFMSAYRMAKIAEFINES